MKTPPPSARVAIITRTKDRPTFLRRAMESVLAQRYTDWVHIVVNDGGDPAPVEVLARFFGERYAGRLHCLHHASSEGMQNASNAGIAASQSEFIVIHDDDDSWHPDFLATTVPAIRETDDGRNVQGAVAQTIRIFEEVRFGGRIEELRRSHYYFFEFANLNEMRRRNLFPPIAFLYRRAVHDAIGLFRQEFDVLGDHDFNLRFLRRFDIEVLPDYLAYYHWRTHTEANTVTRGVQKHRERLHRMKNAYLRAHLDGAEDAVGDLDAIPFPDPPAPPRLEYRRRETGAPPPVPFPDPLAEGESAFDVLSLDVFDTALRRLCDRPEDVFGFVEARWTEASGVARPFALARRAGEELARARHRREVTLEEIYTCVAELLDLPRKDVQPALELELATERELLHAHPQVLALARRAVEAGKRLVFLSDMYLPAAQIAAYLRAAGYPEGPVHVSCEVGESKHDGTFYDRVIEKLGAPPARIVHLGDNFRADVVQPSARGWQVRHLSPAMASTPWCDEVEPHADTRQDRLSQFLVGVMRREHRVWGTQPPPLLERLGFELAGPLYAGFLNWLTRTARADGKRRLVLLGRDGHYLAKALERLKATAATGIEGLYLEASRKVLNFASFRTLDEDALDFLATPHPSLRVIDFLDRLGLEGARYGERMALCGFDDPTAVITPGEGGKFLGEGTEARLKNLFRLLRSELEALFAADREAFEGLLAEISFDREHDAIVDLGWAASSAKALARLLQTTPAAPLHTYYFGTRAEAAPEDRGYVLKSYYMHLGEPVENALLLSESVNWIEALFSAPFPTLLALRKEGPRVVPHYAEDAGTGFDAAQQAAIWRGAEQFLKTLPAHLPGGRDAQAGWAYLTLTLRRLLGEPAPDELAAWGGLQHSDGFGLEMRRPLIMPVEPPGGPDELLEAYDGSTWRRGFLASLEAGQAEFVLDRRTARPPRTYEQLQSDLDWHRGRLDKAWAEAHAAQALADSLQGEVARQAEVWRADQAEIQRLHQVFEEAVA
ncbi:MAG: glycosyltransferase, partial [Opitutales bacterium]